MEPSLEAADAATDRTAEEIVATIDQKALRLSALLRDIDNHPIQLDGLMRERVDDMLEMLGVRIAATRALLRLSEDLVPLGAPA